MAQKKYDFLNAVPAGREEMLLKELKTVPGLYNRFLAMDQDWKERFLDYCRGVKTLPLTYDPFFKRIFHPDIHPDRLSRFISCLLGMRVRVLRILPAEETLLEGGALMIMDILVQLEDGSLVNVEIQKIPYAFPGERISCYSSDLVLRQYSRVKGERGKKFTYHDMKKVYTIIILEKTPECFHEFPNQYIHHGKTEFNTGLEMELLQEYCIVALDVFRKNRYPEDRSEQDAWLSLLATENLEEVGPLVHKYPWLGEIYEEMAGLMHNPEEVLNMFSEALRILDKNTVEYMVEEQQKELDEKKAELRRIQKELEENQKELEESQRVIEENQKELEESQRVIEENRKDLEQSQKEIEANKKELSEQKRLADTLLSEKDRRIAELEKLLNESLGKK